MRFILCMLMMIAVALFIGFGMSYLSLTEAFLPGHMQVGAWLARPDSGAVTSNPYMRAHLVRRAAFQLGRAEGIEFSATTDNARQRLKRNCDYIVTGSVSPSSFWTLTAVDDADVNIVAPDTPGGLRSSDLVWGNDGQFILHVGTRLQPGNWLELVGDGPFRLILTLYGTSTLSGAGGWTMPAIRSGQRGCR